MTHRRRDDGFTLIELLVVMIIIGVLAAIAIPVFLAQKNKAKDSSAKSDVSLIAKDVTSYYVDRTSALTIAGGPGGGFTLTDQASSVVDTGRLSAMNSVSVKSKATSESSWCVAVTNADTGITWSASANAAGLSKADCP